MALAVLAGRRPTRSNVVPQPCLGHSLPLGRRWGASFFLFRPPASNQRQTLVARSPMIYAGTSLESLVAVGRASLSDRSPAYQNSAGRRGVRPKISWLAPECSAAGLLRGSGPWAQGPSCVFELEHPELTFCRTSLAEPLVTRRVLFPVREPSREKRFPAHSTRALPPGPGLWSSWRSLPGRWCSCA